MAPLVRRSWQPRGKTPVLVQRTRSHQKVSMIAALCVAPTRDRVALYFRLHAQRNINADLVVAFLSQLRHQLDAPVIIVWDRLRAHQGKRVSAYVAHHRELHTVSLPAYAPELNPVEYFNAWLKMNPFANLPLFELDALTTTARRHSRSLQHHEHLLRSFIKHSPLSLRIK